MTGLVYVFLLVLLIAFFSAAVLRRYPFPQTERLATIAILVLFGTALAFAFADYVTKEDPRLSYPAAVFVGAQLSAVTIACGFVLYKAYHKLRPRKT